MTARALKKKNNMPDFKGKKRTMAYSKKSGFKMKGSPMQRNFGIGSPMRNEKTEGDTTANKTAKVDVMFGTLNDAGTKVINEQGNWEHITRTTEGTATYNRAKAAGALSGGPDIK